MEYLLQPHFRGEKTSHIPRTPYVCKERYDSGPFLSYAVRQGRVPQGSPWRQNLAFSSDDDRDSFIQTWLFFGLLGEFCNCNSSELDQGVDGRSAAKKALDIIYRRLVHQNGDEKYVVVDFDTLNFFLQFARSRPSKDATQKAARWKHLVVCLRHAWEVLLYHKLKHMNHIIKNSISANCEILMQTLRATGSMMGMKIDFGMNWSSEYLDEQAKQEMLLSGWCPSDICRMEEQYSRINTIHMLRMMDRSLPKREGDHRACTNMACKMHQINDSKYVLRHHEEDCHCKPLKVDPKKLDSILMDGDKIPLLRLVGDINYLDSEIVESGSGVDYVALSHVWADGLGNPHANALQQCQVFHIRELIDNISVGKNPLLLWIDTLCCPAIEGPGKDLAISKLVDVYRHAKHVLVLDASLTSYPSAPMSLPEKLLRIFTSPWMRRLWTLQEGALASSLYFQFADQAISLIALETEINGGILRTDMRTRAVCDDVQNELQRLITFNPERMLPFEDEILVLAYLDQALQYRGVSVPSDEPLCIATLLDLDLKAVLHVKPETQEQRMTKIWELIDEKYDGIPPGVTFFLEERLESKGWRWALKSLLDPGDTGRSIHMSNRRLPGWATEDKLLARATGRGLRVRFPGFYLRKRSKHVPWPGVSRIPEYAINFKDERSGRWYQIVDKPYAFNIQGKTRDQIFGLERLWKYPLHEFINEDNAVLVMENEIESTELESRASNGILGRMEHDTKAGGEPTVTTNFQMIVNATTVEEGYIFDVLHSLATELRSEDVSETYLDICNRIPESSRTEDERFQASLSALKSQAKGLTAERFDKDPRFREARRVWRGYTDEKDMWTLVLDWWNNDYVGIAAADGEDGRRWWIVD